MQEENRESQEPPAAAANNTDNTNNNDMSDSPSDTSNKVKEDMKETERNFSTFSNISELALSRQNQVIDFINNIDWEPKQANNQRMHVIFPPRLHLVQLAWKKVQNAAKVTNDELVIVCAVNR